MFHRIRRSSGRTVAAIAAAAVLAGTAAVSAASAAPATRAEALNTQTVYTYYSSSSYTTIVGVATAGCGEPWTLQDGYTTRWVRTKEAACPN